MTRPYFRIFATEDAAERAMRNLNRVSRDGSIYWPSWTALRTTSRCWLRRVA